MSTLTVANLLRQSADRQSDHEVIRVIGDRAWTARELWHATASLAIGLKDQVRPGEIVVTAAATGPSAVVISAAVSALGAVELPLAPDAPAEWAGRLVAIADAVTILASHQRASEQPLLGNLATALSVPLVRFDADMVPDEPGAGRFLPVPRADTDAALAMTTSGTTGRTKAALLPVGAPVAQARRVARAMNYGPGDVILNYFAWHHINARNACFLPALLSGAQMVVAPRFSASGFVDVARAEGVTAFNFMGSMCRMLLAQPPQSNDRDHQIRAAYGGPAPAGLVAEFRDRYGVVLRQAYACTELGDVSVTGMTELCPGAAGRPVDEYEVRIVDERGDSLRDGEVGELLVRPRRDGIAFLGYLGDEEATREAWTEGWFRTRDRARLTDGWLWIEGRTGDVIRRRGINIDPQHVEDALATHPDVSEAAAVAVPSELTEDEVLAVVVLIDGAGSGPDALWAHCKERLARHATPRYISIEQRLPVNQNLKLDRAALRRRGLPPTAWDAEATTRPVPPA